jgi:hypothetical protein
MSVDQSFAHLVANQVGDGGGQGTSGGGTAKSSNETVKRLAVLEANLQVLTDKLNSYLKAQEAKINKSRGNRVDYGLKVRVLESMRLLVEAGQAIFIGQAEPVIIGNTVIEFAPPDTVRELRYVYLDEEGLVSVFTSDPTQMGKEYLPLALVDVFPGVTEITQERIVDIRVGQVQESSLGNALGQLNGNASLKTGFDTESDTFVISANDPADMKIKISGGKAFVDSAIIEADASEINLANVATVGNEFVGYGDGIKAVYELKHKNVTGVTIKINDAVKIPNVDYTLDYGTGTVTFLTIPALADPIKADYTFTGTFMVVVVAEKAMTPDGHAYGVLNYVVGSNRAPDTPPELPKSQHAIGTIAPLSSNTTEITQDLIDNDFEIVNRDQAELQGSLVYLNDIKLNASEVVPVPTAYKVLRLDEYGYLPTSITGDATTVGGIRVTIGSLTPSFPIIDQELWIDTSVKLIKIYTASGWQPLGAVYS